MPKEQQSYLPFLRSRQEYFDFLDGYAVERSDELQDARTKKALVKTFLFETLRDGSDSLPLELVLREAGVELERVDETLFRARPRGERAGWGLIELLERRHPVLYTMLDSKDAQKWASAIVDTSPWLDRVWFSAPIFSTLWSYVHQTIHPQRFSRLTFEYEARYELEGVGQLRSAEEDESEDEDLELTEDLGDVETPIERRSSRCTLVERIAEIDAKLRSLQEIYWPFYSITQLRVPSATRGGHDFYFNGRVTNRSDSFMDHRQQVAFVLRLYRTTTEAAEETLWMALERAGDDVTEAYRLHGAPVLMRFSEPLSDAVFERWMTLMFARRSRFRLWGNPIRIGNGQVHVYGVDRHLWQPVYLEFTRRHVIGILPKGTCGNTVHRLVTNIQRFVDPAVQTWIGEEPYATVINRALVGQRR